MPLFYVLSDLLSLSQCNSFYRVLPTLKLTRLFLFGLFRALFYIFSNLFILQFFYYSLVGLSI